MSVATTYARALLETSANRADELNQIEKDMEAFVLLVNGNKQLRDILFGPIATRAEKVGVVQAISEKAGYSPAVSRFLMLLARKNRLPSSEEIQQKFKVVRFDAEGGIIGRVEAAEEISGADLAELSASFGKKLGKKVRLEVRVNPELLAGLKVMIGGITYDGSLKSQLNQVKEQFIRNSSLF